MPKCLKHRMFASALKMSGMLLIAGLMLCPVTVAMEEGVQTVTDAKAIPCQGLKPFNNLDELLYQFYINLDNDCLFYLSTAELEEAWSIKILDEERFKPKNYYPLIETQFYNKPYETDKDAFYIELTHDKSSSIKRFELKITKAYFERFGSLFPDENMPELLAEATGFNYSGLLPCYFPNTQKIIPGGTEQTGCYSPIWEGHVGAIILNSFEKIVITKTNFKSQSPSDRTQIHASSKAIEKTDRNTPCRGLKPYKDIDDLLYQFYINLDSDCLFRMTLRELEEVWGTEIWGIDFEREKFMSDDAYQEFARRPCDSDRGAFIIEADRIQGPLVNGQPSINRFEIKPAMGCSKEKGGILGNKNRGDEPFRTLPSLKKVLSVWSWYSSDLTYRITFHKGRPGDTTLSHILVSRTPEKQLDLLMNNQGE